MIREARTARAVLPLFVGFALMAARPAAAPGGPEAVSLEATADRTTLSIGDPVTVTVRLRRAAGVRVGPFTPERFLGSLGLLGGQAQPAHPLPDGRIEEVFILRVAPYQVGPVEVPSFEVDYTGTDGRPAKASSAPIALAVVSVLQPGQEGPADIKPPAVMPERRLWPWVAAALSLAAALAAWWLWRRRRAGAEAAPAAPAGPPQPPHEIALAELQRLLASGLLESGRLKEFYIELAEILRRYLAGRFTVETFERTTEEILEALREVRAPAAATGLASEFLGACDLVKFAKHRPAPEESRATVAQAHRLIAETRPAAAAVVGTGP